MSTSNGQDVDNTGNDADGVADPDPDPRPDVGATDALAQAVAGTASASPTGVTTITPPRPAPRKAPRVALFIVLGALVALAIGYVRWYAPRAAMLRFQEACLADQPPADLVVYDEHPERAAELLARVDSRGEFAPVPASTDNAGPPIAGRVPSAWRELRRRAAPQLAEPHHAVLFLHERQTQIGVRGLVCVEADRIGRQLRITFVRPGALLFEPVLIDKVVLAPQPKEGLVILNTGGDPLAAKFPPQRAEPSARTDLRIFAGQPGAKDPTHFTIPFEHDGLRGEFDMWVFDEQTVHYVERQFAAR